MSKEHTHQDSYLKRKQLWHFKTLLRGFLLFLLVIVFASPSAGSPRENTKNGGTRATDNNAAAPTFQFSSNVLKINTRIMELMIQDGAIIYVRDLASKEILVNNKAFNDPPSRKMNFIGFASINHTGNKFHHFPTKASSITFMELDSSKCKLTYSFSDNSTGNTRLIFDVSIDKKSGEVIIQLTGLEGKTRLKPVAIDLPIMSMAPPGVILGSGAKYLRTEAEATDQTSYVSYGLNSPAMAVSEGTRATMAVWSEATQFAPEHIRLEHQPAFDHLILHSEQEPGQSNSQTIISSTWRIGTYTTWVKAAKRWREKFEERTGAKPLWKNNIHWVRKIHVVFDALNQDYGGNTAKYAELAKKVPPEKVLFSLWNGDRIVLFGDPALVKNVARPTPEVLALIKKYGWPLLLYHPFNLIYSEKGTSARLEYLKNQGWLPDGYQFRPDYSGAPAEWQAYWSDVKADYYDGNRYFILHPGSRKFQDYLIRNLGNYLSLYQANGAYLDILGADHSFLFTNNRKVIDGKSYALGEASSIAKINRELPQFAVMSEYQSPWVLPYIFYTWEGPETHLRQNYNARTRINHPLRVALTGSYSWTREVNSDAADDIASALMGALPAISLIGDYNVSDKRAEWSQKRAELFASEELFNDIPDKWDPQALAYYQGKKGHWFKFKLIGSGYGYVEELPNGTEVIRLTNVSTTQTPAVPRAPKGLKVWSN